MKRFILYLLILVGLAIAALLISTTFSHAGSADPGTYYDEVVPANTSNVYHEYLLADGQSTYIGLSGDCPYGQDIDLWVYDVDSGKLIAKSTTYGCYEEVYIDTFYSSYIKIVVENQNKPFATAYDLTVE